MGIEPRVYDDDDDELVQGRYAVARGRFEPTTLWLQGTGHTPTPPIPYIS